jgi:O-antigen ligase
MTLAPIWRTRIFAVIAALLAMWCGVAIAQQSFFWPIVIAVALSFFALVRWQPLPLSTALLGVVLFGYIVGNRGFAQILLLPNQPLLPAEAMLALGGALLLVHCAWRHDLPFRREPLNLLLLGWMALGALRVAFDFRTFGLLAIRDFATVYYAAFFYLAQDAARDDRGRQFLQPVILVSCSVVLVTSFLSEQSPDFFFSTLTVRGSPLIYYKGDLVGTSLAVGSVLFFLRFEDGKGRWNGLASLVLAGGVLATNNRASLAGLLVAALWLLIGRRWKFMAALVSAGAIAAITILLGAAVLNRPLEKTPLFGVYERIISLADPSGARAYRGETTFNKGDNNLFRTTWWSTVIRETVESNPYVGLGFGHDLADRFVREYYPESAEEFAARSPHNILVTVFARMGAVGLVGLIAVLCVFARRTWQAVRRSAHESAPWCAAWVMFVSACFGVVLEGPMGAVVFWCLLGLGAGGAGSLGPPRASQRSQHQTETL